ncbi:MAG TPA: DUF748 domain-containing protein, partial [Candidatus Acidoferrum sp.]|nr:DUF748 domain-containing protein [Candidatus Acidoferrum sp.]
MGVFRRPRTWIAIGIVLVALVALVLVALPPLARRIAVAQLGAAIGREVTIGELRLNLFTRRLSLAGVRVADRSGPPLAEFERLDVQFRLWPLLRGRLHLDSVALSRPRVRIVRVGPNELNVSDILARFASAPPSPKKEPLHLTLGRFALTDGGAVFDDRVVSPPQTWEIAGLRADAQDLATVGAAPGRANVAFTLGGSPFTVTVEDLRLQPVHARALVVVRGLELTPFWSYVPTTSPMKPQRGRFETKIAVEYDAKAGVKGGGEVTIADIGLVRAGETVALVSTPTLSLTSRDVVYRDGVVTAARLEVTGVPTIVDSSVSPPRRLPLRSLKVSVENVEWPFRGTARTALTAELPESGTVVVNGTAELASYTLDLNVEARDVALAAYRRFLPVDVPFTGRAVATLRVKGVMSELPRIAVTGSAGASKLTLGPGARPPLAVESVEITGLEADWPERIRVARVAIRKPAALLEREKDGSFPLRTMLTGSHGGPEMAPKPPDARSAPGNPGRSSITPVVPAVASAPSPAPASPAAPPTAAPATPAAPASPTASTPPAGAAKRLALEVGDITLVDGDVRFVDRTTTPFYSEEISKLAVGVRNLRNAPDARADVTVQGIVGAAGAIDLKGQVAPFGEPFYLDVAGELRDFAIPRANPYLKHFMDWVAGSGRLSTKVHYRVVGDQLEASNDIVVERLNVERAAGAEADKKIGIPLGLAVALMKDTRGDIRLSVPVGGKMSAPEFSFGEAIATVIKNVMVKIVTAPFRAIGKIFQKGDTVESVAIDPVVFEPGGASLTPEVQKQLQKVADFMRATPQVKLTLQPIVGERDLAALRARAATARIQRVQREEKLADLDAAAARVFKTTFPDKPAPKATDEIVTALAERETVADDERAALISRRLDVVRKAL